MVMVTVTAMVMESVTIMVTMAMVKPQNCHFIKDGFKKNKAKKPVACIGSVMYPALYFYEALVASHTCTA